MQFWLIGAILSQQLQAIDARWAGTNDDDYYIDG